MTVAVPPGAPEDGLTERIVAGGLRVTDEVLPLAKAIPAVVVPVRDAKYAAGIFTLFAAFDGSAWNVTRRVPPETLATPRTRATIAGPALEGAGCNWTCTSAALIVPLGNPVPVKVTTVTAGSAALGVADAARVMTEGDPCASNCGSGDRAQIRAILMNLPNLSQWNNELNGM